MDDRTVRRHANTWSEVVAPNTDIHGALDAAEDEIGVPVGDWADCRDAGIGLLRSAEGLARVESQSRPTQGPADLARLASILLSFSVYLHSQD